MGQKPMIAQKIPEASVALLGCTSLPTVGGPQVGAGALFLGDGHIEEVVHMLYMSPK